MKLITKAVSNAAKLLRKEVKTLLLETILKNSGEPIYLTDVLINEDENAGDFFWDLETLNAICACPQITCKMSDECYLLGFKLGETKNNIVAVVHNYDDNGEFELKLSDIHLNELISVLDGEFYGVNLLS